MRCIPFLRKCLRIRRLDPSLDLSAIQNLQSPSSRALSQDVSDNATYIRLRFDILRSQRGRHQEEIRHEVASAAMSIVPADVVWIASRWNVEQEYRMELALSRHGGRLAYNQPDLGKRDGRKQKGVDQVDALFISLDMETWKVPYCMQVIYEKLPLCNRWKDGSLLCQSGRTHRSPLSVIASALLHHEASRRYREASSGATAGFRKTCYGGSAMEGVLFKGNGRAEEKRHPSD